MNTATPSGFHVVGPLPHSGETDVHDVFADESDEIKGHYAAYRAGEQNGQMDCFHLVRDSDGHVAGFIAIHTLKDLLDEIVNAYISVRYVFIRACMRHRGLSNLLLGVGQERIVDWLKYVDSKLLDGQQLRVMAASDPISVRGYDFAKKLDCHLLGECGKSGWVLNSLFSSEAKSCQEPALRQRLTQRT